MRLSTDIIQLLCISIISIGRHIRQIQITYCFRLPNIQARLFVSVASYSPVRLKLNSAEPVAERENRKLVIVSLAASDISRDSTFWPVKIFLGALNLHEEPGYQFLCLVAILTPLFKGPKVAHHGRHRPRPGRLLSRHHTAHHHRIPAILLLHRIHLQIRQTHW